MFARLARPSDAAALAALNAAFNGFGLSDAAHIERSLRESAEIVCIASFEGKPAGFCCAQVTASMCYPDKFAEITELYVAPHARRRGLARELLHLAETECQNRGATEVKLLTGSDNLPARTLYEAMGYEADDEIHYSKELIL